MRLSALASFAVTVSGMVRPAHAGVCGNADSVQRAVVHGSVLVVVKVPASVVVAVGEVVEKLVVDVVDVVVGSTPLGTLSFAMNASVLPFSVVWNAPAVTGKPPELRPVT